MIEFQCDECGKKYSVKDEMAGKSAKCPCGRSLKIPGIAFTKLTSSANSTGFKAPSVNPQTSVAAIPPSNVSNQQNLGAFCPNCQTPIQPSWRGCPVCGMPIQTSDTHGVNPVQQHYQGQNPGNASNQFAAPPAFHVGNESVVKANINNLANFPNNSSLPQSFPNQYGQHQYGQPGAMPLIHVGNESVVKADINASTNYHGQYIAQQQNNTTIINESAVGALVKLFSGGSFDQAEEKVRNLPNNPTEVVAILSQTLREILRESKRKFKSEKGLFNFSQGWKTILLFLFPYGVFFIGSGIPKRRIEICQKILDHLHELALKQRSGQLAQDVEFIDDKMTEIQGLYSKSKNIEIAKVMGRFSMLYSASSLLIIPIALSDERMRGIVICPLLATLVTGSLIYFAISGEEYIEKTIASITEGVSKFSFKWS